MTTSLLIRSRLRIVMEQRGVKRLADLTRLSGVSYPTLSSLYHNRAQGVTWAVLAPICLALSCTPGDILEVYRNDNGPPEDDPLSTAHREPGTVNPAPEVSAEPASVSTDPE